MGGPFCGLREGMEENGGGTCGGGLFFALSPLRIRD